jgi:hypothetical protein
MKLTVRILALSIVFAGAAAASVSSATPKFFPSLQWLRCRFRFAGLESPAARRAANPKVGRVAQKCQKRKGRMGCIVQPTALFCG